MADKAKPDGGERRPNPVDIHVGTRVRLRRKQLGVSQERLADALGLTFQQVQKYERGANRISASKLWDTAGFLSVPIAFFFDGLKEGVSSGMAEPDSAPFLHDLVMDRDVSDLVTAFAGIERRRMKRRIVELVREISAEESALQTEDEGA
ncbi:MAG TPA: helix-turn-helix transcriptional regulator [Caulobacteraceae bacterium]|jgi:transcriptional regulator with XRE-family HTH domain